MKQDPDMSLFVKHVADKQQSLRQYPVFLWRYGRHCGLVPVRRLPTQSQSRHFGSVSEKKTRSEHVTQNALAARNNEAYGQANGRQSFSTVLRYHKNTGHGNFFIGRFQTRARNGLSVWDSPTDTPSSIFSEGRGRLYTGYLKRIIHLQTVRQNWRIKSGGLFIQN